MRVRALLTAGFALAAITCAASPREALDWKELPALPNPLGLAGSYTGISHDALLVAGGSNFPGQPPWEHGTKAWYDTIYVLPRPDAAWQIAGRLPRASGYGLSISVDDGVLLIGGGDAHENFSDVLRLRWDGQHLSFDRLPSLPVPLAMPAGALVGRTIFIAGGLDRPDAVHAQKIFLSLDLDAPAQGWRRREPWPGPERFLATGGTLNGDFYLAGGAQLVPASGGGTARKWLRDVWRFTPGCGWKRLADLPTPLVASPAPAPALGPTHLLLIGGDDGALASQPQQTHPGFPRNLWAYDAITDTWARLGALPFSLVTTTAVRWDDRIVVAAGEAHPGVRSNAVWAANPRRAAASFGWLNYTTLALYLAAIAGVGLWFMRRQKTTADYFRASGRVPWWAAGLSIFATMLSSITFLAIPAKAYATDWTFAPGNLAPLLLAPVIIAFYLPFFRQLNVTSAYEYLERRFNLPVRLYASGAFILFQTGRMAVVILLPAFALSAVAGLDLRLCVLLIGLTCAFYTAAGGIEAVVWTDAVQAIVLLGAALFSLILILLHLHGTPAQWWSDAASHGKLRIAAWNWDLTSAGFGVVMIGSLLSNLAPYTADQTVVQRYLTTRDTRAAARAIRLNAWLTVPSTVLFFAIGTGLFLYYRQQPAMLEPELGTDSIFPLFIARTMPAGVAGIVVAGVFAAAQSTASSSINSVVTAVMTDWVQRFRPGLADRTSLRLSQTLAVVLGLCGTGVALYLSGTHIRSLWDAYLALLGLLASGLAGLFALGIFTRRANGPGALVGALGGAGLLFAVQRHTSLHFLLYGAVGTVASFGLGWIASLVLPQRPRDLTGLTWRSLAGKG